MKCAGSGWLLLGAALTLLHCPVLNSQEPVRDRPPKITFTSEDGAFGFTYPGLFVLCKRGPNQSDRWTPGESCEAYLPVCSDASGRSDNTVACVAYPAAGMKVGTNFQAAAFSVNRLKEANTASECLAGAEPPPQAATSHPESVNGVEFNVTKADDAAAGNRMDGYAYRSFHGNVCYELGIRIASSNLANYDPAKIKSFDLGEVRRSLKKILNSFTFLK